MAVVKLRALVLREVDFGDYDRYLTALTEEGRKIEILCKNVRRGGKKQIAAARQFCFSEFVLSERGSKYTLREADLVKSFWGITQDIEKYALACYLAEVTVSLSVEEEEQTALCRLIYLALQALLSGKRDILLIKAAFEWRLAAESGYAPNIAQCMICGNMVAENPVYFSIRAGSVADKACIKREGGDYIPVDASVIQAIWHVMTAELSKVYAFALTGTAYRQFCALAEKYMQYHIGRKYDTLDFFNKVKLV